MLNAVAFGLQEDRLRGRGTETEDSLSKRLAVAKAELQYGTFISKDWWFLMFFVLYCFGITVVLGCIGHWPK